MGWENDLNVAGCWLPDSSWSRNIVNAGGDLTYDVTKGILDVTVLPELIIANTVLDGVLSASTSAINNFYSIVNSSKGAKLVGKILLVFLCLMAFVAAAS
jgi:hypothetical protein